MASTAVAPQSPAGMSIDEIARELGVHRTSLYDSIRAGTLPWPFVRVGEKGRRIIVSRKAFEAWQSGQATPKPDAA
jgi:excisionase family DNA binding protein